VFVFELQVFCEQILATNPVGSILIYISSKVNFHFIRVSVHGLLELVDRLDQGLVHALNSLDFAAVLDHFVDLVLEALHLPLYEVGLVQAKVTSCRSSCFYR